MKLNTFANSHLSPTSFNPAGAAEPASTRKHLNYYSITSPHIFIAVALETMGPVDGKDFLKNSFTNLANDSFLILVTPKIIIIIILVISIVF